jgi:hypothetical protein
MTKKKIQQVLPHPEVIVASREDSTEYRGWQVKGGSSNRGDAYTDFGSRTMRLPTGSDETSRLIRLHELIHSKVSPQDMDTLDAVINTSGISPRLLECSEEWRVNRIMGNMGHDTALLLDGSEKESGKKAAQTGTPQAYNEALAFALAISASPKAVNALLSGIRSGGKPEWAKQIRTALSGLKKHIKQDWGLDRYIRETDPTDYDGVTVPRGFLSTISVARYMTQYMAPVNADGSSISEVESSEGGVEIPVSYTVGNFAPLVFDKTILLKRQVKGHLHRRKRSANTGKRVLYPSRVMTDPQKRVFGTKVKSSGGVVVFDISGSMSLSDSDIETVLDHAPNAVVMAYSHRKNSTRPNAWVLASRGKRCDDVSKLNIGNIGNGVDGPALQWATKVARKGETIVWVCDGQITDSQDKAGTPEMMEQCHQLIDKHNIVQAPDVEGALKILKNPPRGGKRTVYGRMGRYQANRKPSRYALPEYY